VSNAEHPPQWPLDVPDDPEDAYLLGYRHGMSRKNAEAWTDGYHTAMREASGEVREGWVKSLLRRALRRAGFWHA
jgi:hypothetical protein